MKSKMAADRGLKRFWRQNRKEDAIKPPGRLLPGGFCSPSQCVKKKNRETWHQSHLVDQELHQLLEKVDADLAQEACQKGCLFCRGKLHRADFDRKPRGG